MNVADSNLVADYLRSAGFEETDKPENANIVIINTCTVREHAELRALTEIGKYKNWKTENRIGKNRKVKETDTKVLIVIGCMVERIKPAKLLTQFPFLDIAIGAKDIINVNNILSTSKKIKLLLEQNNQNTNKSGSLTAFVTIMRGCNNYCSYCIVPYVRGKEKSRNFNEILTEIRTLVKSGTKEVSLLGQNVNSYKYRTHDFADLLTEVNKIPGLLRIRFMTNHPKDIPDKVINSIAGLDKVCKHLHLPLQSGSNKILKRMNRKYTREKYLAIIKKLRKKVPGISITTDVMVGFPGESNKDFIDTVNTIKNANFDFAYVFKYSVRKKTKASTFTDDVPVAIKETRHKTLLDLCNKTAQQKNSLFINKQLDILVEKIYNEHNETKLFGKTDDNRPVTCLLKQPLTENPVGKLVKIKITEAKVHSLTGVII
jgi:tRNA-2-methylthio-N6-dimethylallyladenosine synthase